MNSNSMNPQDDHKNPSEKDMSKDTYQDVYDDGNIPDEDLPKDITPDEVPGTDGPGGE